MSETYTPPTETSKEPTIEDNFDEIQAIQQNQEQADMQEQARADAEELAYLREAAQRVVAAEQTTPTDQLDAPIPWKTKAIVAASLVAGVSMGVTGAAVALDAVLPAQQVETASTTIPQGGDITGAVDRTILELQSENMNPANPTFRQDLISQAVEIHTDSNGIVQPGEEVTVVAHKSPIFGNVSFEAVKNNDTQIETTETTPSAPDASTEVTIPAPITH